MIGPSDGVMANAWQSRLCGLPLPVARAPRNAQGATARPVGAQWCNPRPVPRMGHMGRQCRRRRSCPEGQPCDTSPMMAAPSRPLRRTAAPMPPPGCGPTRNTMPTMRQRLWRERPHDDDGQEFGPANTHAPTQAPLGRRQSASGALGQVPLAASIKRRCSRRRFGEAWARPATPLETPLEA